MGPNDIRDHTTDAEHHHCVRTVVLDGERRWRACGHRHRSQDALERCARKMARGWPSGASQLWVTMEPWNDEMAEGRVG